MKHMAKGLEITRRLFILSITSVYLVPHISIPTVVIKNTANNDSCYKNFSFFYQSEPIYEGVIKVILLLQVSSHNFEPTFIILVLIGRVLPDQSK